MGSLVESQTDEIINQAACKEDETEAVVPTGVENITRNQQYRILPPPRLNDPIEDKYQGQKKDERQGGELHRALNKARLRCTSCHTLSGWDWRAFKMWAGLLRVFGP